VAVNSATVYDCGLRVAELYDQSETSVDDVALILRLVRGHGPLRILEPFCGTGRILIPMALAGHEIVGLDQSRGMLARAEEKVALLPPAEGAGVWGSRGAGVRQLLGSDYRIG